MTRRFLSHAQALTQQSFSIHATATELRVAQPARLFEPASGPDRGVRAISLPRFFHHHGVSS